MNNYKDLYWFFENKVDTRTCKKIIALHNKQQKELGRIGTFPKQTFKKLNKKQNKSLKEKRNSYVTFFNKDWIFKLLKPFISTANKNSGWNFNLDWCEPVQITKYVGNKKQHYDWHCDTGVEHVENDGNNKIRKLSIVISLSDSKDYRGGDFEFQYRSTDDPTLITPVPILKNQGTVVVFPSYIWHRVKPVTEGVRYSLVARVRGQNFK